MNKNTENSEPNNPVAVSSTDQSDKKNSRESSDAGSAKKKSPSPVAKPNTSKTGKKKIAAFILGMGLVYLFFMNHTSKTSEEDNNKSTIKAETLKPPVPQAPTQDTIPQPNPNQRLITADELHQQAEEEKLHKIRMLAPGMVYSAEGTLSTTNHSTNNRTNAPVLGNGANDSNVQFMSQVSTEQAPLVNASRLQHPDYTLAQGTLIWATLESQIASDLPGMVRAVTSQDIYSEEGTEILLPRGSRLIGQYTSSVAQGQQRVFVVWQRVIRPDHIDIQLNSPGTDPLGAAGMSADSVDHHFWAQFGNALLLSVIGAGTATVGVNNSQDQFNSAAAYREALAGSFSETASNSLESTGAIKPTIYINQGKKISVFVARDLDFFSELKTRSL